MLSNHLNLKLCLEQTFLKEISQNNSTICVVVTCCSQDCEKVIGYITTHEVVGEENTKR